MAGEKVIIMAKNNSLTEKQKKALKLLKSRLNGRLLTHLNSCVHCGLCGESCHYYLATKNKNLFPGRRWILFQVFTNAITH